MTARPQKHYVFKGILICLVLFVGAIWIASGGELVEFVKSSKPETAPSYVGEATKNLGHRSWGFGSMNQAKALLALINSDPGKAKYQIMYQTDVDTVIFGCDLNKEVLIRLHQKKNGRGTHETWKGYIMERLAAGAAGGSLNDTPMGKMPASRHYF